MRRGRAKSKVRFVKHKPKRSNQVHDVDVLRWNHMVSEQDAVAVARQAGLGAPCLRASQNSPTLSPERCRNAVDFVNTLPEDARHAMFKHCQMVARHERMLLEGQERLKYVQAQVKEMKARLPRPPMPPDVNEPRGKGPPVDVIPVAQPSCWASCCGLFDLPEPPAPPPPPPSLGPMAIFLPKAAYFEEMAEKKMAARRLSAQRESTGGHTLSGGGASSTSLQPVSTSVGGASDTGIVGAAHAKDPSTAAAGDGVENAAELPGQLDALALTVTAEEEPGMLPAEQAVAVTALAPPARALAPLPAKASGMPQSLVRPLAPLPPAPMLPRGAGAAPGRNLPLPPLPAAPPTQPMGGPAAVDLSRYQDPQSLEKITRIQAAHRGSMARKEAAVLRAQRQQSQQAVDAMGAKATPASRGGRPPAGTQARMLAAEPVDLTPPELAAAAAAAQQPQHPFADPAYDLSRYQDPQSLEKITRIQAAQRGSMARKEAAARRAERQQPQVPEPGASGAKPHPFVDPSQGAQAALPAQGMGGGGQGGQYDLSRYQDPESLEKIIRIQAAQRGSTARREVAALRVERQQQPRAAESTFTAMAPQPFTDDSAAPPASSGGDRDGPYDLSRYQDPRSIQKLTHIQAAQRGRLARREVAALRAERQGHARAPSPDDFDAQSFDGPAADDLLAEASF